METVLQYLTNPVVNLIIAALVGVITNLVAAKMTEKTKVIWWGVKSATLRFDYYSETDNLRIAYKVGDSYKNVIDGLSTARLVFWSSGKEAILAEDIAKGDPLSISFPKDQSILELRIVASNNPTIALQAAKSVVTANFEYLHRNQGIVLDVLYSGKNTTPRLTGTLKGGKIVDKEINPPFTLPTHILFLFILLLPPRQRIVAMRFFSSIGFLLLLWALLSLAPIIIPRLFLLEWHMLFVLAYIIIPLLGYGSITYKMWNKAIIPRELAAFYENFEEDVWWSRI